MFIVWFIVLINVFLNINGFFVDIKNYIDFYYDSWIVILLIN